MSFFISKIKICIILINVFFCKKWDKTLRKSQKNLLGTQRKGIQDTHSKQSLSNKTLLRLKIKLRHPTLVLDILNLRNRNMLHPRSPSMLHHPSLSIPQHMVNRAIPQYHRVAPNSLMARNLQLEILILFINWCLKIDLLNC